jgi:hypothetical protein
MIPSGGSVLGIHPAAEVAVARPLLVGSTWPFEYVTVATRVDV